MKTRAMILSAALAVLISAPVAIAAPAGSAAKPALSGTAAGSAPVQMVDHRWGRHRDRRMGPRRIVRKLHRRGFTNIWRVRSRGDVYIVRANGRRGAPLRLVVDAYSGKIIGRTVVRGRGFPRHNRGYWGGHWNGNGNGGVGFGVWGRF